MNGTGSPQLSPYFRAVALDFDGTLAHDGIVAPDVLRVIDRVRHAGVCVILVSGRILAELENVFPEVRNHFDALVLENGGVLIVKGGEPRNLATPCDPELAERLRQQGAPVRSGAVLLASRMSHQQEAFDAIGQMAHDYVIVPNRAEMMILPAGVNKASGVHAALEALALSEHNTVAIGDAENDQDFLDACELAVAVQNAVPGLKADADLVLREENGAGVALFLEGEMLAHDFRMPSPRRRLELGQYLDGSSAWLTTSQANILVTGRSMSGKSYVAGLIAEKLIEQGYSVCLVDPEGDYMALGQLRTATRVGGAWPLPEMADYEALFEASTASAIVDVSLLSRAQQTKYVAALQRELATQRCRHGRPQWIIVDEAHYLPLGEGPSYPANGFCLVTYDVDGLPSWIWTTLDAVIALSSGEPSPDRPDALCVVERQLGVELLPALNETPTPEALVLHRSAEFVPKPILLAQRSLRHVRHWHKYMRADLPDEEWFYFDWGLSDQAVARNVEQFHELLWQCPSEAIRMHAVRHQFSEWFRQIIRDPEIAEHLCTIEHGAHDDATESTIDEVRRNLARVIEARYLE